MLRTVIRGPLTVLALLLSSALLCGCGGAGRQGKVLFVDINAPDGGDGLTWEAAFQHPQDAVDAALADDEIWVAEGTYTCSPVDQVLAMKEGVDIYGGFVGTETNRDERDWAVRRTTLEGGWMCVVGASRAHIDGFVVTGGDASGLPIASGGGMGNGAVSDLTIANCAFQGNHAQLCGGAVYNGSSSVTLVNCTFSGNIAGDRGGAIFNDASDVTITNCTFSGNQAGTGGGIYNWRGSVVTMSNCILWGDTGLDGPEIYDDGTSTCAVTCSDVQQDGYAGSNGNINSDPLLVDADGTDGTFGTADDDLHVSLGSPCIDAGTETGAPDHDLDGNSRPMGSGYDMGAYEYQ